MNNEYIDTAAAANKWDADKEDVAKACREGIIEGVYKDENGKWQIPEDAANPFAGNEPTDLEKRKENIIIAIISGVVIVSLLIAVGFNNIKLWLFSPFVWKDPDYIHITLAEKEENSGRMELTFLVENESLEDYNGYEFYITSGVNTYRIGGVSTSLPPFSTIEVKESFVEDGSQSRFYKSLKGREVQDIKLNYHVKSLSSGGEYVFKTNGWLKPVLLLVLSLIAAFLGFCLIKIKWLRMTLKVLGVPSLLILGLILMVAAFGGGSSGSESATAGAADSRRKNAAERYKQAAGWKAGAEMGGRTADAARAQAQMDRAMADMISSANSPAAERYKQAAGWKAGAKMGGRTADAARAQAQMDRAMADMINEKNRK